VAKEYHLPPDQVIHEIPLAQLFAMAGFAGYCGGADTVNGYETRQLERILAREA
jgi:hypothetical protein